MSVDSDSDSDSDEPIVVRRIGKEECGEDLVDSDEDSPEQAAFRAQCQTWLSENHPGRPPVSIPQGALELSDPAAMTWLQQWQKSAFDAGMIGCSH